MDYWAFQLSQVKEYMRYRKLPLRLRLKVEDYYEHRFHHKLFDEDVILSELSKALRAVNIQSLFFTYLIRPAMRNKSKSLTTLHST